MDRTVSGSLKHSNGNFTPSDATHCMGVLDAVYWTARSYQGGARALASRMQTRDKIDGEFMPMNESTFAHKVNPNCFSHNVSIEEAQDMMVVSKDFRILHALAANTGHVAIQISAEAGGATFEKVGAMAKEFSEVVSAVSDSQSTGSQDGARISANEMSRIEREAAELIGALNSLLGSLRAQQAEVR